MNTQTDDTTKKTPSTDLSVPGTIDTRALPAKVENPVTTVPGSDPIIDQIRAENEQLKATIRLAAAHREITGELARAGARSPGLLFEIVKGELQFGEDGTAQNAAALVERLKRKFPEQFAPAKPPPSIDAGAGVVEIPQLTKEALAKMKPAEIAGLDWEEVKRVLAA